MGTRLMTLVLLMGCEAAETTVEMEPDAAPSADAAPDAAHDAFSCADAFVCTYPIRWTCTRGVCVDTQLPPLGSDTLMIDVNSSEERPVQYGNGHADLARRLGDTDTVYARPSWFEPLQPEDTYVITVRANGISGEIQTQEGTAAATFSGP